MVSIAFKLNVDGYYFFLGGDTINEHIDKMIDIQLNFSSL